MGVLVLYAPVKQQYVASGEWEEKSLLIAVHCGTRCTFLSKKDSSCCILLRGLPHYKQLNFGGGSDWLGATAAVLINGFHTGGG
jgi:hypothetical protein